MEDYAGSEKIFYPPEALDVNDTPLAEGPAGTLAYYAPWGDVAIFYGECRGANGLYALGEVISGGAQIESLTGEVRIEKVVDEVGINHAADRQNPLENAASVPQQTKETGQAAGREGSDTALKMRVQVGESTFSATLKENAAVDALIAMMGKESITVELSDYAGFEKVGSLGLNLPTSDEQITTQAGDIVLYQGNQIVMFYGSNSWNYTPLGHIDNLTGWERALGAGNVTVTFSLEE